MEQFIQLMFSFAQKISKYEIVNNLIPGSVLCYILSYLNFNILFSDNWCNIVLFYIVGLINGRISSVVIEPLCKIKGFVQWRDYSLYNATKKARPFVVTLQESANMYRSFISVFLVALICGFYKILAQEVKWFDTNCWWIALSLLLLLFIFSYRKQVNEYVVKNIDEVSKQG